VHVGENLSGITTPMTEQSTLQVFKLERFLEERVLLQVDHTETQVQACRHVSVVELEFILGEDLCVLDGGSGGAKGRERGIGLLHGDDVWMCKRDRGTTARERPGERGKAVLYTNPSHDESHPQSAWKSVIKDFVNPKSVVSNEQWTCASQTRDDVGTREKGRAPAVTALRVGGAVKSLGALGRCCGAACSEVMGKVWVWDGLGVLVMLNFLLFDLGFAVKVWACA
jgi:hypothetical protein